jgi:hypothetical protein
MHSSYVIWTQLLATINPEEHVLAAESYVVLSDFPSHR